MVLIITNTFFSQRICLWQPSGQTISIGCGSLTTAQGRICTKKAHDSRTKKNQTNSPSCKKSRRGNFPRRYVEVHPILIDQKWCQMLRKIFGGWLMKFCGLRCVSVFGWGWVAGAWSGGTESLILACWLGGLYPGSLKFPWTSLFTFLVDRNDCEWLGCRKKKLRLLKGAVVEVILKTETDCWGYFIPFCIPSHSFSSSYLHLFLA